MDLKFENDINSHNDACNSKLTIRPNDMLFEENGININSDEVDIKGNYYESRLFSKRYYYY